MMSQRNRRLAEALGIVSPWEDLMRTAVTSDTAELQAQQPHLKLNSPISITMKPHSGSYRRSLTLHFIRTQDSVSAQPNAKQRCI